MRLDGPPEAPALLVLAHGAGAGMDSDFMQKIARGLADRGLRTCRFEFPYMREGRRAPDRQEVLEAAYRAVLAQVAEQEHSSGVPLILGGKSLGGRIASHVGPGSAAVGLVFLGYPLHPPGKPDRARTDNLAALSLPMLFVQGTRDPFCPLPALRCFLAAHHGPADLAVIDDGDHSFKVRRGSGRTTEQAWDEAAGAVARWTHELVASR